FWRIALEFSASVPTGETPAERPLSTRQPLASTVPWRLERLISPAGALKPPPDYGRAIPAEGGSAMMQFTDQIQRAFAETVRSGPFSEVKDLPARLRDFTCDGSTLDVLWYELLRCYRDGPRQAWATVLLEAMRPDLAAAVAVVPAFPPVVTREDYAQQLMANLLAAALDGPVDPA